ncbi:MAG TPA: metallophosphoesterase [Actinomycetota bacterium]|nr:metallophosphoesterase [Actinomycetota bacterium]
MIRLAAVGDVHFGLDSANTLRPHLEGLSERADALLLAGDLTRSGRLAEARVLADELRGLNTPVVAVLGNHDYHCDEQDEITNAIADAGVHVLEGDHIRLEFDNDAIGIAGVKGFGGGFAGACGTEFGEPEMKSFIRHTRTTAERLAKALDQLPANEQRVVLMHYSPIKGTLLGERLEIYPFLGSYLLAEVADRAGVSIIFHGHAHGGTEKGVTPGGVHVRNVAQPVIKHAYNLYCLGGNGLSEASP